MAALPLKFFEECSNEPAKPWAIKGVIALDEDSSWFGPPGSLKSALLTDMSVYLAAGRDWRGFKTKMQYGVVYFAFERAALTRRRLAAYAKRSEFQNLPIAVAENIVDLIDSTSVEIIVDTVKAAQERFSVPVGLIIIDTFAKGVAAGGADEDKAQHVNLVAANLKRVHEEIKGLHIAMIGHTGKDESKGERGSSAKLGHVDLAVRIAGEGKIKTATVTKGNDQPEDTLTAFEGEEIELGKDTEGDPVMAFIVSQRTVHAPQPTSRVSNQQALSLQALTKAIREHGENGWVAVDKWREELFRAGLLDPHAKNPREPFRRLRQSLVVSQRVYEQDGMVRIGHPIGVAPRPLAPLPGGNNSIPPMPPFPGASPVTPSHLLERGV